MSDSDEHQEPSSEGENEENTKDNSSDHDEDQVSKSDENESDKENDDKGKLGEAGQNAIGKLLGGEDNSGKDSDKEKEHEEDNNESEKDNESDKDTESEKDNEDEKDNESEKDNEDAKDNESEKDNEGEKDNESEKDNEDEKDNESEKDNEDEKDNESEKDNEGEKDNESEKDNEGEKDNESDKEKDEKADKKKSDDEKASIKKKNKKKKKSSDSEDESDSDKESTSGEEAENNDEQFSEDEPQEVLVDKRSDDSDESDKEGGEGNQPSGTTSIFNYNNENEDDKNSSMMITEISNNVSVPTKQKTNTGRRFKTQPIQQPTYTDDEILSQIDIMMKDKKLPEQSYHQPIRNYVSRGQYAAAEQGDYKKAEELEAILDMLTELLNQDDSEAQEQIRKQRIEEKKQIIQAKHEEFLENWNREKEKKINEQEEIREKMEIRQQREIDKFQDDCNDPGFTQRYNKPSQNLINLRKAENQLAMAKYFDRAKNVKKQADNLQIIESQEAIKRMDRDLQIKYQALEERQEREKEFYEQHKQTILDAHEKKREKEQLAYEKALANLNAQLAPPNKDKMETIKPPATKRPIRNNTKLKDVKNPATLDIPKIDVSKFKKQKKIIKPIQSNNATKKKEK